MKDIARLMTRHGIKPRPRKDRKSRDEAREERSRPKPRKHRVSDAFVEVTPEEAAKPQSVYRVPDSWEVPASLKKPLPAVEKGKPRMKSGPKPLPEGKTRKTSLSFSVSEEEANLLRRYAADHGMHFSQWARAVLFKAMDVAIPPRK